MNRLYRWFRAGGPVTAAPPAAPAPKREPDDNFGRIAEATLLDGRQVCVQARPGMSRDWICISDAKTGRVLFDKPSAALYDLQFCERVDLENALAIAVGKYEVYLASWRSK